MKSVDKLYKPMPGNLKAGRYEIEEEIGCGGLGRVNVRIGTPSNARAFSNAYRLGHVLHWLSWPETCQNAFPSHDVASRI